MPHLTHRAVGAVAITGLGIAAAWMKPEFATTIRFLGSFFIFLVITVE